jgi:D-serine dehydratase
VLEAGAARWADTTMDLEAVAALGDEPLDWRFKAMPPDRPPVLLRELGEQGWHALAGDLVPPVMLLRESALTANVEAMAALCRERGVLLAPHGKTSMAPQLLARQVAAGCWALTAATPAHLRVYLRFGVRRILYANQLLDPGPLRWLAGELARDPGLEVLCLVDSPEGVRAMEPLLAGAADPVRLAVLVELGHEDGRGGCRTVQHALEVARAVGGATRLELVGVEAFEGTVRGASLGETLGGVDELLARCDETLRALREEGLLAAEPAIVSAGGSAYFDRVLDAFAGRDDVACVLRAGCYVTQDGGFYDRLSPLAGRAAGSPRLHNALEVWGLVQSRPQPDLAVVGFRQARRPARPRSAHPREGPPDRRRGPRADLGGRGRRPQRPARPRPRGPGRRAGGRRPARRDDQSSLRRVRPLASAAGGRRRLPARRRRPDVLLNGEVGGEPDRARSG